MTGQRYINTYKYQNTTHNMYTHTVGTWIVMGCDHGKLDGNQYILERALCQIHCQANHFGSHQTYLHCIICSQNGASQSNNVTAIDAKTANGLGEHGAAASWQQLLQNIWSTCSWMHGRTRCCCFMAQQKKTRKARPEKKRKRQVQLACVACPWQTNA